MNHFVEMFDMYYDIICIKSKYTSYIDQVNRYQELYFDIQAAAGEE